MTKLKKDYVEENIKLKKCINMFFDSEFLTGCTVDEVYAKLEKVAKRNKRLTVALYSISVIFLCLAFYILGLMVCD